MTEGGADHVFDVVGSRVTVTESVEMARPRGTITVIGLPSIGARFDISADALFAEKRIQGSKMGRHTRLDIQWYCKAYLDGRLMLDELVSHQVSLDDLNGALSTLGAADVARQVVSFAPRPKTGPTDESPEDPTMKGAEL